MIDAPRDTWTLEAFAYLTRIRVISDGTKRGTVLDTDLATAKKIRDAIKKKKRRPIASGQPSIPASYSPTGIMAALESIQQGHIHYVSLPDDAKSFLDKEYGIKRLPGMAPED